MKPVHTDLEKEIRTPEPFDTRRIAAATAAALRSAIARRNEPISFGLPDTSFDGRFIETKWGSDFLKEHQLRNFAFALKWRGQHVGIETAPSRASQMNPKEFEGLRRFPDVESYLRDLEGSSDWQPRDGWGLASMWRTLVSVIPEAAGTKIAHLYPNLRPADEIISATIVVEKATAEQTEAVKPVVAEPIVEPTAEITTLAVQLTPPRVDLAPEAIRFLNIGVR